MKDILGASWSQAAKDLFEEREEAKRMFGDFVRGLIGWMRFDKGRINTDRGFDHVHI